MIKQFGLLCYAEYHKVNFRFLGNGGIVCLIDGVYPVNELHSIIPVGLI